MAGSRAGAKFGLIAGAIALVGLLLLLLILPVAFHLALFSIRVGLICLLLLMIEIGARLLFRR